LRNSICNLCCSLQTRTDLGCLMANTEFLSMFLGPGESHVFVCSLCKEKLDAVQKWWRKCRLNLDLVRQVKDENDNMKKKILSPDTTWPPERCFKIEIVDSNNNNNGSESEGDNNNCVGRIPCLADEPNITLTPVDNTSLSYELRHIDETMQSTVCYEESSFEDKYQSEPLNLIKREANDVISTIPSSDSEDENIEVDEVAEIPPFFHHQNIRIPSMEPDRTYSLQELKVSPGNLNLAQMTPEERRKLKNREASRRYREKARGDPELLKKMREQQNRRQKKYYARLQEKKQLI